MTRTAPGRREARVNPEGEMDNGSYASVALVQFLFGIFCAYWAQTTGRSPWLWFFLGFFFAPITGLVLLHENSKDQSDKNHAETP